MSFEPISPLPSITTIFILFLPFVFARGIRSRRSYFRASQVLELLSEVAKVLSRCCRRALEESEQLSIDLIFESRTHAVRSARNDFQCGTLNNFGRDHARDTDGYDLIVIAVQDKSWYIESLEVFREIRLGKGLDAFVVGFVPCEHRLEPKGVEQTLRNLRARPIGAIERGTEISRKLSSVGKNRGPELVKLFDGQTAG